MPHASSQSPIAGAPRHPIIEARALQDQVDRLVGLMQLAEAYPSHAGTERVIDAVEELAEHACKFKQHYRGPSRPCHPPLAVSANGRRAAW